MWSPRFFCAEQLLSTLALAGDEPVAVSVLNSVLLEARPGLAAGRWFNEPANLDRSMILLQDVVQVLDRPVAATASQESFLFHP